MSNKVFLFIIAYCIQTQMALSQETPPLKIAVSDKDLAALILQIRSEVETLRQELQQFEGAVLAFDRAQTGGAICPNGWSLFSPAQGRTLVGAGIHSNADVDGDRLTNYAAWSDDQTDGQTDSTGGKEKVTLSIDEMPRHQHQSRLYSRRADGSSSGIHVVNANPEQSAHKGGNQPHENMPPYVALYFCKKN